MPSFSSLITDLTQEGRQGRCRPAYGFEHLFPPVFEALASPDPKLVLVTGPEGCGKSRFIEGLALAGAKALSTEPGAGLTLLRLGSSRIASGQDLSAALTELASFLGNSQGMVLVVDNAASFLGLKDAAGLTQSAREVLAPIALQAGIRCIAVLNDAEHAELTARQSPPADRTLIVTIPAFDRGRRIDLLINAAPELERKRNVAIDGSALHAVAVLVPQYAPTKAGPDDLIGMLDHACVRYSRKAATAQANPELIQQTSLKALGDRVGAYDVVRTVEENAGADIMNPVLNMKNALANEMVAMVPGQRDAIFHAIDQLVNFRCGFSSPFAPAGMLLLHGPPGAPFRKATEAVQHIAAKGAQPPAFLDFRELASPQALHAALDTMAANQNPGYLLIEHAEAAAPETTAALTERVVPDPASRKRSPLYKQFIYVAYETPPGSGRIEMLDSLKKRFPRAFLRHCGTMAHVASSA